MRTNYLIKSSLKALSSYQISSKIVSQCRETLESLSENKNNPVSQVWVPGYCGILGNEKSNELTRKGSGTIFIKPELVLSIYTGSMIFEIKKDAKTKHEKLWENPKT